MRKQRNLSADAGLLGHSPNRNVHGNGAEPTDIVIRNFSNVLCSSLLRLHLPTFRTFRKLKTRYSFQSLKSKATVQQTSYLKTNKNCYLLVYKKKIEEF